MGTSVNEPAAVVFTKDRCGTAGLYRFSKCLMLLYAGFMVAVLCCPKVG